MKQITIVPAGSQLEQGTTYIDLCHLNKGEFKAIGSQQAEPGHYFVAKNQVDYQLWNALIGVNNPERLGLTGEA